MVDDVHGRLRALQRDPYPTYARARAAAGLTFVPELDAWLVSRYADAREVLRRPEVFSSANAFQVDVPPSPEVLAELMKGLGGAPIVLSADGAAHTRYREPLTRGLTAARVAAAIPFITESAEALVDSFASDGRVEWVSRYARPLPGAVIGHLIGLDPVDVPIAVRASYRAERLLFHHLDPADQVSAAREVVALQHLLDGYARRRRENPQADLCTELVNALEPGPELVSNLQNLLIAGLITTAAQLGTGILHLLRHRDQWELLCERPDLIPAAVAEILRYDTAIQGFRRITTRPVTLDGHDLPVGTAVFVAFGSANRDEAAYDRADEFDITRTPSRSLAFGHGVHSCPGALLAREQVRITLATLTRRLPGLRLTADQQVVMQPTLIHRSPEALFLTW